MKRHTGESGWGGYTGEARGVKHSCAATKLCMCVVIAKSIPELGDRAKDYCGGFVLISTHFSLERGFRGKVE